MPTGQFSTSQANKSVLSALGLITPTNTMELIKRFPKAAADNYLVLSEAMTGLYKAANKEEYHREKSGRTLPSIVVQSNVAAGAAGSAITITLGSASYIAGDNTKSPVAVGQLWKNNSDGILYEVTAVSKTTAGAHTATIKPIKTAKVPVATAGDYFLFHGYTKAGEASGLVEGLYPSTEKVWNYITTIVYGQSFTDYQLQEKIDIPDSPFYKLLAMEDAEEVMLRTQELELMFGESADNIGSRNNEHQGLINRVKHSYTNGGIVSNALFQAMKRRVDAEGFTNEFDLLQDTELGIKMQDYIDSTLGNGRVVLAQFNGSKEVEIARNFRSYDIYGIRLNLKDYAYFNSARIWGAPTETGVYKDFGLMIPKGLTPIEGGKKENFFKVAYQPVPVGGNLEGGTVVHVKRVGGLAATPTSHDNSLSVSWTTHKGIKAAGVDAYSLIDL